MRILLVEDEHNVRRALSRALAMRGHAVTEATSAAEAIVVICDQPFDLLVVDVNLPDATGWDVLRRRGVGARPNRKTPAVVMSAVSPSVARLKEFSPMGVLRKPFPIDALHLMVERAGEALPAVPVTEV